MIILPDIHPEPLQVKSYLQYGRVLFHPVIPFNNRILKRKCRIFEDLFESVKLVTSVFVSSS